MGTNEMRAARSHMHAMLIRAILRVTQRVYLGNENVRMTYSFGDYWRVEEIGPSGKTR